MASFHSFLRHEQPRLESPAKVFAKLKSKVQKETLFAAEEGGVRGRVPPSRDKHGGDAARHRAADGVWASAEHKENQGFGPEARALTLSPMKSPQKSCPRAEDSLAFLKFYTPTKRHPLMESTSVFCSHGGDPLTSLKPHTPTKRPLMESTTMLHSQVGEHLTPKKLQTPTKRPLMEARAALHTNEGDPLASIKLHTPTKRPLMESRAVFNSQGGEHLTPKKLQTPTKRPPVEFPGHAAQSDGFTRRTPAKRPPAARHSACAPPGEEEAEAPMPPAGRRRKAELQEGRKAKDSSTKGHRRKVLDGVCSEPSEESCPDPSRDALGRLLSVPAVAVAAAAAAPYEGAFDQHRSKTKSRECTMSLMSPAKMFALMKRRESRQEQEQAQQMGGDSRPPWRHGGAAAPPRDALLSSASSLDQMEDDVFSLRSPTPASRPETADSQSDASPPPPPQRVLLDDPLVLNTPHVSIPKRKSALRRDTEASQSEGDVVYLKKWFLRRNRKGLFVDGLRKEDNMPWNSNIIVERVSSTVLKTLSGRVYILVGKMKGVSASEFPSWLLKRFANGFPSNWKELYEKFRTEGSGRKQSGEAGTGGRGRSAKTAETSSLKGAVKRQRQPSFKTPESCAPSSSSSSAKVSRSGRVIKPPLEYWKGGRVLLDADMNVTIFECYDTSICKQESSPDLKGAKVFRSCSKQKQKDPQSCPAPERRVKAPARRPKRDKVRPEEETPTPPLPPVPLQSRHLGRPEEDCGARKTGARGESRLRGDPEPPQTRRSKRILNEKSPDTEPRAPRPRPRRVATPPAHDPDTSSGEDLSIKRRRRAAGRRSTATTTSSEESEQPSGKTHRAKKNGKVGKAGKSTKMAAVPAKPAPKMAEAKPMGSRKPLPPPQDDEWTPAELDRLKMAVSSYPKHTAGYWTKVARMVGARSAEECHHQHTAHRGLATPSKKTSKTQGEQRKPRTQPETALISARAGTLRRKQQVRHFLETMPKDDVDDGFSSAFMQEKRFEMPSLCPSEEQDFTLSELEPVTPVSAGFLEVKTPQCLHITPGMLGSPSSNNDDKYVYQLQKRMKKKKQASVRKQAPASKSFTPSPSLKRSMRKCGNSENDTFVVWEMFPDNAEGAVSDSGEEEDFYFTDDD